MRFVRSHTQMLAYVFTTVVAAFSVGIITNRTREHADDEIRAALKVTCIRVNALRHQSNVADYVVWEGLREAARNERALAKVQPPDDGGRVHGRAALRYDRLSQRVTWTPLTNCDEAVQRPFTYKYPQPQKFTGPDWQD